MPETFAVRLLVHLLVVIQFLVGAAGLELFFRFSKRPLARALSTVWWVGSVASAAQFVLDFALGTGRDAWAGPAFSVAVASLAAIMVAWREVLRAVRGVDRTDGHTRLLWLAVAGGVGLGVGLPQLYAGNLLSLLKLIAALAMLVLVTVSLAVRGLPDRARRVMFLLNVTLVVQAARPLLLIVLTDAGSPTFRVSAGRQIFVLLGTLAFSVVLMALDFWALLINERHEITLQFDAEMQREFGAARRQRGEALASLSRGLASDISAVVVDVSTSAALARRDPALQHEAEVLELAAEQGASLLQRLTDVRPQAQSSIPVIDIATVLRTALPVLKRLSPQHSVLLTIGSPVLVAACSPADLERAVTNLVLNARDASPPGATIRIRAVAHAAPPTDLFAREINSGRGVLVQVSDAGAGITPELVGRLFEPYFTTKGTKGTGLGLTSIRTFLRSIGGDVACASIPGEGATFSMWIPAQDAGSRIPSVSGAYA